MLVSPQAARLEILFIFMFASKLVEMYLGTKRYLFVRPDLGHK